MRAFYIRIWKVWVNGMASTQGVGGIWSTETTVHHVLKEINQIVLDCLNSKANNS